MRSTFKAGIVVTQVTMHIIYRRKKCDHWFLKQYSEQYREARKELKIEDDGCISGALNEPTWFTEEVMKNCSQD